MPIRNTNFPWTETTAVVTGATRGIGRCVVQELSHRGTRVGCIARSTTDLEQLAAGLAGGDRIAIAVADVGDRAALERAIEEITEQLGPVDVLVNNAGMGLYGPVVELDPADAERLMRANYLGVVYATCAVLPGMVSRRRGHIVNVGSIAGRIGSPFEAAYAASKFAVTGFTEAMSVEAAPFGVSVSLVNPGPVATSFFEARGHPYARSRPKQLDPFRVADVVIAAIEHCTAERTVPASLGAAVVVRHLLPPLFRRGSMAAMRKEIRDLRDRLARQQQS